MKRQINMKWRKEERYIFVSSEAYSQPDTSSCDENWSEVSTATAGRLQSSQVWARAISRMFDAPRCRKYQRHPKHSIFNAVEEDVGTRTELPLEQCFCASETVPVFLGCGFPVHLVLCGGKQGLEARGAWSCWCRRVQQLYVRTSLWNTELSDLSAPDVANWSQHPKPCPHNDCCAVLTETVSCCKWKIGLPAFLHRAWLQLGLQLSL